MAVKTSNNAVAPSVAGESFSRVPRMLKDFQESLEKAETSALEEYNSELDRNHLRPLSYWKRVWKAVTRPFPVLSALALPVVAFVILVDSRSHPSPVVLLVVGFPILTVAALAWLASALVLGVRQEWSYPAPVLWDISARLLVAECRNRGLSDSEIRYVHEVSTYGHRHGMDFLTGTCSIVSLGIGVYFGKDWLDGRLHFAAQNLPTLLAAIVGALLFAVGLALSSRVAYREHIAAGVRYHLDA